MGVLLLPVILMIIQCKFITIFVCFKFIKLLNSFLFYLWYSKHHDCCEDSPTPDDSIFRHLALTYAKNHPVMREGNDCNETFPNGITNGAYWYDLSGKLCLYL